MDHYSFNLSPAADALWSDAVDDSYLDLTSLTATTTPLFPTGPSELSSANSETGQIDYITPTVSELNEDVGIYDLTLFDDHSAMNKPPTMNEREFSDPNPGWDDHLGIEQVQSIRTELAESHDDNQEMYNLQILSNGAGSTNFCLEESNNSPSLGLGLEQPNEVGCSNLVELSVSRVSGSFNPEVAGVSQPSSPVVTTSQKGTPSREQGQKSNDKKPVKKSAKVKKPLTAAQKLKEKARSKQNREKSKREIAGLRKKVSDLQEEIKQLKANQHVCAICGISA